MAENRVLTLEEVLGLPEGARVWVEERPTGPFGSAVHTRTNEDGTAKLMDCNDGWYPITGEWVGGEFRVWSLPQPPTQEEMEGNPWEVEM